MVLDSTRYSVDEFDALVQEPENQGRLLEYIGGEIVDAISVQVASAIAAKIMIFIGVYLTW